MCYISVMVCLNPGHDISFHTAFPLLFLYDVEMPFKYALHSINIFHKETTLGLK